MTINNARRRSGVLSERDAATNGGSVRHRKPRSACGWPVSPGRQASGDHGISARAVVAKMTHLGGATHASRRATAAGRAPSIGDSTWSGWAPWPGRPRFRSRGVGPRMTWCRDVRGEPGAHVESACGASASPAKAVRHRCGQAPTSWARGWPSGGSPGGWAWGGRAAASSSRQRGAPSPSVDVPPGSRAPALQGPMVCGAACARAAGASLTVAGTRGIPGLRVAASW